MEQFRTEVEAPEFSFDINHRSVVTMLGSCFAENMGDLMSGVKVNTLANPFGILFNPFSIMNSLSIANQVGSSFIALLKVCITQAPFI